MDCVLMSFKIWSLIDNCHTNIIVYIITSLSVLASVRALAWARALSIGIGTSIGASIGMTTGASHEHWHMHWCEHWHEHRREHWYEHQLLWGPVVSRVRFLIFLGLFLVYYAGSWCYFRWHQTIGYCQNASKLELVIFLIVFFFNQIFFKVFHRFCLLFLNQVNSWIRLYLFLCFWFLWLNYFFLYITIFWGSDLLCSL